MALPDPIPTLTVNSIAYDFVRTGLSESRGTYKTADAAYRFTVEHTHRNRNRHTIRLDRTSTVENPLIVGNNLETSMSVYTVIDMPRVGYDSASANWMYALHTALMQAGSPDYSLRILQGEL